LSPSVLSVRPEYLEVSPQSSFHRSFVTFASAAGVALLSAAARACPNCPVANEVWRQVATQSPGATLGMLTLAFGIVGALIAVAARLVPRFGRLLAAAMLLGAGMGAFIDGILLHQVLQWHAMLSSPLPPSDLVSSKVNMFWDGIFHLYAWCVTLIGVVLLVREVPAAPKSFRRGGVLGGALTGWGSFNLIEGALNHHAFAIHHVHPGMNELAWDLAFLLLGAALFIFGALLWFRQRAE
jgi:uncharacterized membrane protein